MINREAFSLLHRVAMCLSSGQSITPKDFLYDEIKELLSKYQNKENFMDHEWEVGIENQISRLEDRIEKLEKSREKEGADRRQKADIPENIPENTKDKTLEYLDWALSIIDSYYQETGKIHFADVIIWKAAKSYCRAYRKKDESSKYYIEEKLSDFIKTQTDFPPEFNKILNDNFWELM